MNPIAKLIIDTLITKFQVSPETVTADSMFASLELDSLVLVELGVILGNQFGMDINGGELMAAGTIGGAAVLVEARCARSEGKAV